MDVDFSKFFTALIANADWVSILVALGVVAVGAHKYFSIKRVEEEAREFENYHRMLQGLVRGPDEDRVPYIDAQIAVIFELRFMRKYHAVSVRVLERSIPGWRESETKFCDKVADEAQLTIDFIIKKRGANIRHC